MSKKREISEGKKNIIAALLKEYDIQSAKDIQEALKDLLGGTIWINVNKVDRKKRNYSIIKSASL